VARTRTTPSGGKVGPNLDVHVNEETVCRNDSNVARVDAPHLSHALRSAKQKKGGHEGRLKTLSPQRRRKKAKARKGEQKACPSFGRDKNCITSARISNNRRMDWLHSTALAAALAWASGIRLYAILFLAGVLSQWGYLTLPPALQVLEHPLVMGAAGVMAVGEFFADKVPAFDSVWDTVHTFIRIPAGAFLAAAAYGETDPVYLTAAAILGGAIASSTHLMKSGTRALINTSPEPFSNWGASAVEDVIVPVGFIAAIKAPLVFLLVLAAFLIAAAWLLPKLFRAVKRVFSRLVGASSARA
jgi:hypothetical protein